MKIQGTKKVLIFFIALTGVLAGLNYLGFSWIRGAAEQASSYESENQSTQSQINEFSKYSATDLQSIADAVNNRFVPADGVVKFIETIETAAKNQKLISSIQSVDVKSSDFPDKETIELKIQSQGSWADIVRFINYLEFLPYKTDIQSLNLAETSAGTATVANATAANSAGSKIAAKTSASVWKADITITTLKFK